MKHENVRDLSPEAYEAAKRELLGGEPQAAAKTGKPARHMTTEQYEAAKREALK